MSLTLGSLRAHVVESLSNIQIHSIDGLPSSPNACKARAAYISAISGHIFGVNHFTTYVHTIFVENKEIFMKILM